MTGGVANTVIRRHAPDRKSRRRGIRPKPLLTLTTILDVANTIF
jgi:hypothetical protein